MAHRCHSRGKNGQTGDYMGIRIRLGTSVLAVAGAALLSAFPARASLIATIQPVTVTSGPGSLQVTLRNTGPAPVTLGGFQFQIVTTNTDITFTDTDFNTVSPYIFAGDSLLGPVLNSFGPGQSMDGNDFSLS